MQNRGRLAWYILLMSLFCCVFEGAVRKWGVGDKSIAGKMAYLSKDILMGVFLLMGAGRANASTRIAQPYLRIGLGLLAIGAITSISFGLEPMGAVLSIRTFFILPLTCWAAGRQLPRDSLRRLALWITILSLPMSLLAVRQFYSPSNSRINRYSTEGEGVISTSGVSERVRATGTFSYITGFGDFCTTAVCAGIVTFTLARTRRERWLGYAGLAAGACCACVTVSRSVALISVGLVVAWAFAGGQFGRKARTVITIGIVGSAALMATGKWDAAEEISNTVVRRHESANKGLRHHDSFAYRMWYQFVEPMRAIMIAPIGHGLGSEQTGRTGDTGATRLGWTFESAWGRTIMEFGVLGMVGFIVSLGVAFAPLAAEYRKNKQGVQRTVLVVTAVSLLARALIGFQFNHVSAYFFWAASATILALGNVPATPRPVTNLSTRWRYYRR